MAAGPKFGSEAGKNMLVRKAPYILESSGAAFRAFLAYNLDAMGYRKIYYNPDLWLWSSVKPDGIDYYGYILCYVNYVLCISHNPRK